MNTTKAKAKATMMNATKAKARQWPRRDNERNEGKGDDEGKGDEGDKGEGNDDEGDEEGKGKGEHYGAKARAEVKARRRPPVRPEERRAIESLSHCGTRALAPPVLLCDVISRRPPIKVAEGGGDREEGNFVDV